MRLSTTTKWIAIFLATDLLWLVFIIGWIAKAGDVPLGGTTGMAVWGLYGLVCLGLGVFGIKQLIAAEQHPLKPIAGLLGALSIYSAIDAFSLALTGTAVSQTTLGSAISGIAILAFVFFVFLTLIRFLLSHGSGVLGVARTVLDEAIRMKVAVVFMALLLVIVPILPFVISGDEPLRYRVQSFLSYSLMITSVLLSLMTIFLACGTLSGEITDKQIFTTAVKPIGRGAYLLGKWLGIILLDAVLLGVAGAAIYGFTVFYLAQLPPADVVDAQALRDEVLVARVTSRPEPKIPLEQRTKMLVEQLQKENPGAIEQLGRDTATELGTIGAERGKLMEWGWNRAYNQYWDQVLKQWKSVGPMQTEVYVFEGLGPLIRQWQAKVEAWKQAKAEAEAAGKPAPQIEREFVQLRYKIKTSQSMPDNQILMDVMYNGNRRALKMVVGTAQVITLPVDFISDQGTLEVAWRNPLPNNPTVTFTGPDGMELLYKVDSFGPNFLRTLLSMWTKLAFLAMLGLMAATFLGFPVACLLALLIYGAAATSPFLADSLRSFGNKPEDAFGAIEMGMKVIASGVTTLVSKYADYPATTQVVDGRLFSWGSALSCLLWIGVVWTGLIGAIGWLIFKRRELARVQV